MTAPWPPDFERVPDEPWTKDPISDLARGYDALDGHAWYDNLDPTVRQLADALEPGDLAVDYSSGTGILSRRLYRAIGPRPVGVVNVDASKKFLRLAVERLGDEPRSAFRRLHYLKDAERLETLDEALPPALVDRGVDAIACTNAVHLYPHLAPTFQAWRRCLRPDGQALVQSGNVRLPDGDGPEGAWIIDDTVRAVDRAARDIAREDPRHKAHAGALDDADRMGDYDAVQDKFFLPVRPLEAYLDALDDAGLPVTSVETRTVRVPCSEWSSFLQVYHEGVLPWYGGTPRAGDDEPSDEAIAKRKQLIDAALKRVMKGAESFPAVWVYLTSKVG